MRSKAARVLLLLCFIVVSVSLHAQFAQSKFEASDSVVGVKNTLVVYPSVVKKSSWSGVENVLSPELSEDALYQDFDTHNSAYISTDEEIEVQPATEDVSDENSETGVSAPSSAENATASSSPQDETASSSDAVEGEEGGSGIDAEPDTSSTDAVEEPQAETEASLDTEAQAVPEETTLEGPPVEEPETDAPAADSEETPAESVSLARPAPMLFTFLQSVTQLFPFMNNVTETTTSAALDVPVSDEPQQAEQPASETESQDATSTEDTVTAPLEVETSSTSSESTSTSTIPAVEENTATTSAAAPEVPEEHLVNKTITLGDFSIPNLKKGEFITSMQLRLSLAGKYTGDASGTLPVLNIAYDNGSTTEQVGSITVDDEVSNAINGGYFLYALPVASDAKELTSASVSITYTGNTDDLDGLFLDAAWLEVTVEHLDKQLLLKKIFEDTMKRIQDPEIHTLLSEDVDFTREELPHFSLQYNSQRNILVRLVRDLLGKKLVSVEDISFIHDDVGDIGVKPDIEVSDEGIINISIEPRDLERLRPGEYTVSFTVNEGGTEYTDSFTFQWGLLSINPDKTTYRLGESAQISMGALSQNGNTLCDANLALYITDPQGALSRVPLAPSGVCNGNNVVDVPDYSASFLPDAPGEYEMYLERLDEDGSIVAHTMDTFKVEKEAPLSIKRDGPSRIYPLATYPMEITVEAKQAWKGTLIESVPSSFTISQTNAQITPRGESQELSWPVDLAAGESASFSYVFDAPDISPFLYTLGAARLVGEDIASAAIPKTVIVIPQASSTPQTTEPESAPVSPMTTTSTTATPAPAATQEEVPAPEPEPEPTEPAAAPAQFIITTPAPDIFTDDESTTTLPQPTSTPQMAALIEEAAITTASTSDSAVVDTPELPSAAPADGHVAFEEHREWQIASDATGSMIVFWNSAAAIPAGWTCLSCGSGVFYQRFPVGSSTYNTTGGATTHTHTATGVVNTSNTVNTENNGAGEISIPSHTHLYTPTISTVSNLPSYRQYRVIQSNSAGDPSSIPAGAIMMFDSASLPTGWTRLAALDDRYPRGENSIANGGSNTHTHTITGNTSAASNLSTLNSRTGGTQVNGAADNHAHSVSGSTVSQNNEPPYIEVVFATAAVATSTPLGGLAMWTDTPPAQWLDRSSDASAPFSGRFFKGATSYGATGGSETHTPADVFGIVSGAASVTDNARSGTGGNSSAHTHLVDVTNFTTANHLPPYITVIIGKKLGPIPMYTQLAYRLYANANSVTPTDPWPAGGDDLLENEPIDENTTGVKSGDVVRMRMQLSVANSTSTAEAFKLQFATTTALCSDATVWSDVGSATSSAVWRGYNNASPNDGATLSTSTISGTDVLESYEEQNPSVTMPNTVGIAQQGEWDFAVEQNNADAATVYCFRMVESDGTPLLSYTEYPMVLTDAAPSAPSLSKPFDNEKIASSTPTFEFTASDAEGADISYQIQVDNNYDFSSAAIDTDSESNPNAFENLNTPADKDPFANGESIRFDNTTSLTNNTTYYWRVRAKDPAGSNQWGDWSTIRSFTVDTSVTVSTWYQTTDEQFNTNTLDGVIGTSDQAQLQTGSTTGTMYSDPITFSEGTVGTAWGAFTFSDTETSSDLKYTFQYLLDDVWTDISDTDLPGNTAGFDTSPVSLLGVDKTVYPEIRIEANFTNSGASPSVQDWSVSWDYLIETPTIDTPFPSEKVGTTTPVFQFETTDPQSDDLQYQIQWSTSYTFTASTTRTSGVSSGFTNLDNGGDTSPFTSGDTIQFKIQPADALTNGTTYWWRVRARDPLGDNTYSFYTDPQSFTVDTSVTVSTWYQSTQSQFDHDTLSGALTQAAGSVTVATTSDESLVVYAEGTATTPKYREWDGSTWSPQADALDVGSAINWIVTKAAPNRNEYITGTLGTDSDINLQVYENGSWGDLNEVTTAASNVNMRAFDIAYEQSSGDAMVVYCDGDEDPSYTIWDGSSWVAGGSIDFTSGVACGWIRLISNPISDEIILIARNTTGTQYTAWVWDGSSWGDSITGGSMTEEYHEGMTGAYEESGDQAVIAYSNGNNGNFTWRAWNGSSWTAAANQTLGDDFEWGSMAADDGTDNMVICYIDQDSDIGVVRWTGAAWTGQTELDTGGNSKEDRAFDCGFEVGGSRDGYIMVTYSDTTNLRYRYWNGATWAVEAAVTTITDASTIELRRTGANLLQVLAYDDVNDRYDYSYWNGTAWSARQAIETNGSVGAAPFKEPFMMAPRNPGVSATVIGDPLIDFSDGSGPYFEQMSWNDSEPGGSTLAYQIEYYDGDSWELVPDSLISGNSSGISTSPIDLSAMLPMSTYGQIRPVANLQCGGGNCPALSDWTITWAEGLTISGTAHAYDQTTNLTSGTVAVAVNGSLQTGKTGTISGGTWSIDNVNVSPGDIVTVFITGAADANEAAAVTVYDGVGDISGLSLYERHLSIGSDDHTTVSNADLGLYDFTNTEDIFFDVDGGNDLSICATSGCADAELIILANNTYQPGTGGNVRTFDFENNGTFELNGNTMRVGGSWDNNATTSMATSSVIFTATTTQSAAAPWYDSQWPYRIPVTIQASQVDADMTDFPVYVDLSDLGASFFTDVTTDGGDIRVTQSDGITEVPRELVSIDTSGDTGEIYFRASSVSSSTDTTFYIYYGNSSANDYATNATYGARNVWSNGYRAVYHFQESPSGGAPQYVDSTGNSSGTAVNMEAGDKVAGIAGSAAAVDGVNESIQTNFSQSLLASTWSIFLNDTGTQDACDGVMFSRGTSVSGMDAGACTDATRIGYHWDNLAATAWNWAGGPTYPTSQWYMASLVITPSQATAYTHTTGGVNTGSNVQTHASSTIDNLDFGWDSFGTARSFSGTMDEARLSNVARSADWLDAEYRNVSDASTFYDANTAESYASSTVAVPYTLDDADGTLDFYNLTFGETSGTSEWEIDDTLDVNNALAVSYGTLVRDSQSIMVAGNLTTNANGLWSGQGTTTFDGTVAATWSDSTASLQNIGRVVIDGTSKVVTLGTNVKAQSIYIGSNDTFDLSPSSRDVTVLGNWVNNNTFNARSGEVIFAATSTNKTITTGASSFYDLTFNGAGGSWAFTGSTLTIGHNFSVATGTVTMPSATTTISGSFNSSGGTFAHNNALIYFNGSGAKTITLDGDAFTNAFYNVRFQGSGSWSFADAATTSNKFTIAQGTVTFPASTLTIGGDFSKTGGTFVHNNGTVVFLTDGLHTIAANNSSFNNVTIRYPGVGGTWYSPSWTYRIPLTIPAGAVSEDLTDFPIYLDLSMLGSSFFNNVKSSGGDIRVTSGDGSTEVPREIVSIDTTGHTGELYFRGSIAASTSTTFYIYYGNSLASDYADTATYGAENVWSNGFAAVYHFSEDPSGSAPQFVDSTGNSAGTSANLESGDRGAGIAGYGLTLDGTNEGITTNLAQTVLDSTWSIFLNPNGTQGACDAAMFSRGGGGDVSGMNVGACGDTSRLGYHWNDSATTYNWTGGPVYPTNEWFLASLVVESGQATEYEHSQNGASSGVNAVSHGSSDLNGFVFGYDPAGGRYFTGEVDEARLSTVARSSGWLAATYDNIASSSAFYATSSVETLASGRTFTDTNVTVLGDMYIQSGLVSFPIGTLAIGGSYDNNGNVSHNNGTVLFNSTDGGETVDLGNSTLYNMTFNSASGGWTVTNSATTTNDTTLTAGSFTLASSTRLAVLGSFSNAMASTSTTWTGSTLYLGGTSFSINSKSAQGDTYGAMKIAANTDVKMWNSSASSYVVDPSGSLYSQDHAGVDGDLYIFGGYARTSGTEYWSYAIDFDGTALGGGSRQVDVRFASGASANFSNSTLSIVGSSAATTTIDTQGSGTYAMSITSGTTTAQYYSFAHQGANGLSLLGSTYVSALDHGSFDLSTNAGSAIRVASTTIARHPGFQILNVAFSTSSPITAYNVTQTGSAPSSYWWFRNSSGNLDGEAHDNDTGDPGSVRWDDSSLIFTVAGTVYSDDGATPLAGGTCDGVSTPVRVVVENGGTFDGSCSAADGSFSIPNVVAIGDPTLTVFLNNASGGERAVTVTKTPTTDISDLDLYVHRVITRHQDTAPMTIADMAAYDSSDDPDVLFTVATGTVDSLVTYADTELFVWASTTFTPGGTVTLTGGGTGNAYDGSLVIATSSAFVGAGTTTYSLGGSLTLRSGAVFTPASSTVLMEATTSGKTINVAAGNTADFNILRFTGVGGGWNLNGDIAAQGDIEAATGTVSGTGNIHLYNGSFYGNGLVSLGAGTTTIETSNTLGGTQGWTFYNLQLGNGTVTGTTTPASTATTTISGRLTIATGHFLDAGSGVFDLAGSGTVFLESGTFLEGTSKVRYSGGNANILSTTYYDLDLNAGAGTPTYTAAGLGVMVLHDLTVGGDATTVANFAVNDPVLDVNGSVTIRGNGTLVGSDSASFTVGGNWSDLGTFTSSNGTTTFDGAGAVAIAAGNSPFGKLRIAGAGSFTVSDNASTTGAFTLASAGAFTLASGKTLAVGGTFSNQVGGAATTWAGSTLRLVSGTNYLANAKTVSDTYDTLSIGANTDVRMWNSSASSYTVDASGSLYSQDHAGSDGELYIYGNYPGNGGTDNWSYATDFDGTSLGGGSRQAKVFFANGASMSLVSGGLSVKGTASASTTLKNQGSGTYGLRIGGNASTTWSYYDVEDTNSSGLTFSGSPHVSDLSYGDFEIAQNGATGITVGGTAITANAAKTFTNNIFSTTTGITGYNVTATGTTVSSWRFTNHGGTVDGEAFDDDPDGDPGYIVWDDSAASITISGRVYSDEGSTVSGVCDGTTPNILVRVAGLTSYTASCNATTGLYSVSGVTFSPGDSIIAYIDGETEKAAAVTRDPISNIADMDLYENRVIVRHENTSPITIADMALWDSSDDADIPFTAVDGSPDTLTLPANRKLIVWNAKQFAPGGNITVSGGGGGAAYDGTLEVFSNGTLTFAGMQQHSIGGSFILDSGASLTAGQSTTTFTTSGAARSITLNSDSLYNVVFNGSGSWNITDPTLTAHTLAIQSGALTLPSGTTTLSGSWNTTGGSFGINGSPVVFTATSTGNVVRANGSDFAEMRFDGIGGGWSMTDTNATSTASVTIVHGGLTLPSGTFAVGGSFRNEGGTVTHNTSDLIFYSDAAATLLASSSDLYATRFIGAGPFTMEDGSLSVLDDVTVSGGSLTLASGTLSIGGSFDASSGTFANASGTILFNSSDAGETINPGSSPFYSVVLANAAGGWTLAANATTTHNFTLSNAASFTQSGGTRLYVGGVFSNTVGGSATSWNGTLVLDSGTGYAINTKATSDAYSALSIGANTDIRMWNSSATTTTVDTSGSLYSQDHAAVNGALRIYGDFHISTTTEYWSYATDFDGTSLTGSERAVTVAIASGATTTVDGGSLQIVGASGNSTTIENQGSGTYAFAVTSGTFNGLYYAFRDLNADGLDLSGTPTITSLSQGDFELAVNGGSLITVDTATLNANASKVITGNRFATTSAISGYNVTLIGTTSNAWTFVSHTGNLSGEDFDVDGGDACGSIRWNDSSCLLTQQTHYRFRNDDGLEGAPDTEWYNASWTARQRVRLENPDATTYTDAVVKLSVDYDPDMQVDFDDLRFTDESGTTSIPFWVERYTASDNADVWVKVPTLTGEDISTIFMYFDNASATSQSSSTQTFIAADDFDDGTKSEYSGDTSLFTVDSSFAYGGAYGLDATGHESDKATDGIARFDQTVSQGEIIRYLQYIDTSAGSGDEVCTLFGVQSPVTANQNYAVCLEQFGTDRISLVKNAQNTDTSGTVLASSTVSYTTGWYEVEIDWQNTDDIDVSLLKDGSLIATTSANDGTYTSGGMGFTFWFQNGGWDSYTSRPHVDTEPTVYFGAKQASGGASWAAAEDTPAFYTVDDIARVRFALENSGLQITGQTYELEYAEKGAAPSCEAVSSASYAPVPPQSSCGTSPLCMQSTAYYGGGDPATDLLFGTEGSFTQGELIEDPSNTADALTLDQDTYTELEYSLTPTSNVDEPAYCLRVTDNGTPVDTYLSVAELDLRFDPTLSGVTLNGGSDITLSPGATTTVTLTGTASDLNGYTDLAFASSTMYRSGAGAACSPDTNNCYISGPSQCSLSNCAGNSCDISCSADIYYYADPTDVSPYEGEEWLGFIEVADQQGGVGIGSAPGVELLSLRALDVTSAIDYGSLAVSSSTGTYNPTTTIQNLGNNAIDIEVEGTDLTDGGVSTIPASEQIFATTTFDYSSCVYCQSVPTTTPAAYEVDLSKPTSSSTPVTDVLYWGIAIPFGVASNPHHGTNIFYAVGD
jgi:hypothetical protein